MADASRDSRRRQTKSREPSKLVDDSQGRELPTVSEEQTVLISPQDTASNETQAHSHLQPKHSSVTATNRNHIITVDLASLNVCVPPTDMAKSLKLEIDLEPYLLNDPNDNNETLPTYVCYTHVKENIAEQGQAPNKPESMPRVFEPSPVGLEVEMPETPKAVFKPPEKKAAASGKSNSEKRLKTRLNANDIFEQMIRDENIVTKYQSGEKLRVNIVGKDDISAVKRNYRKACYKPVIDRILSNPCPNTIWGDKSSDKGSVCGIRAPNVTVLADIVVRSSSGAKQNGGRTPFAAKKSQRKQSAKPPIVEIFAHTDEDCSEVIDVLGPDYIPVVRRRKKKRCRRETPLAATWAAVNVKSARDGDASEGNEVLDLAPRRKRSVNTATRSAALRLRAASNEGDPRDASSGRRTPMAMWRKGSPVVIIQRMNAKEVEKYQNLFHPNGTRIPTLQ